MSNDINQRQLQILTKRAHKLVADVERATEHSPDRDIRKGGAKLSEVLEEWLDGIHTMADSDAEDLNETILSFATRLKMAEEKVARWPMPPAVKRLRTAGRRRRKAA